MTDTYAGDSYGKKLARAQFWIEAVSQNVRNDGRWLVLAGREGSDIRALRALGVSDADIIAAEIEPSAHATVATSFPSVTVHQCDVGSLAERPEFRRVCNGMLIDFCSPLSKEVVATYCRVAAQVGRVGCLAGLGFMYGREQIEQRRPLRIIKKELRSTERAELMARALRAAALVQCEGVRHGVVLEPALVIGYHSRRHNSVGVPMIYFAARIVAREHSFRRCERALPHASGNPYFKHFDGPLPELANSVRANALFHAERIGVQAAADLFNINPLTLVAWKAHGTRNTYAARRARHLVLSVREEASLDHAV